MRILTKHPVLLMAVAGTLLFVLLEPRIPYPGGPIVIDEGALQARLERRADGLGRDLTPGERAAETRRLGNEEIALREAYRTGLVHADGNVRALLLQRMRAALVADVPTPSRAQLRAYFNANRERYLPRESVDLPAFEEVEGRVGADWLTARQADLAARRLDRMTARYRVDHEPARDRADGP